MQIPHDKFCILPWISLEASPIGTLRPCCLADDEIVDNDGNKFITATANFVEIQSSNYMTNLRQQFLQGQRPQTCRKCWHEERAGRTSKRMHTLERLKNVVSDTDWTTDAKPLMFLDLKLGNICNLKCRICGSWSSSQFAAEDIKFTRLKEGETKQNSYAYQMLTAGAWPRENQNFWQEIDQHLSDIRYIEFTGGEPFLIQEHFEMLQGIVDRGIAHQVEIHYNTNGTVYPEQADNIWQHFKTVEIAFSIDDVGARFEYQRSNAKWDEVQQNIARFFELRQQCPDKIKLQVCTTVNVFNVRYIDEVARWLENKSFDFVYWNMMHDAWYFSIATLPDNVKQQIQHHLENADIPVKYQAEFQRIVDFMNRGASTDGSVMRMRIRDLDFRRKQNLAQVQPELAAIIEYE